MHARTTEGEVIPLDKWTSPDGENRYRIVAFGDPHTIEKIMEPMKDGHPDHREDCPSHQNGLRGIHFS